MSRGKVADRYARAIFELAQEAGTVPKVSQELASFAAAYASSEALRQALGHPLVAPAQRESLLAEACAVLGLSQLTRNALRVIMSRRRLGDVEQVALHLARLADAQAGVIRIQVASARPLKPDYISQLTHTLEAVSGKRVTLDLEHDASLIGGIVIRVGDNTLDGSLRGRLLELQQQMLSFT